MGESERRDFQAHRDGAQSNEAKGREPRTAVREGEDGQQPDGHDGGDLSTVDVKPVLNATDIKFDVAGKDIVLTDDVLYTGRTIRAALDALFEHGRPARVQLLVLIDRGHRELPIEARYVGRTVQTSDIEIIEVKFQEIDGMEKVLMVEKVDGEAA